MHTILCLYNQHDKILDFSSTQWTSLQSFNLHHFQVLNMNTLLHNISLIIIIIITIIIIIAMKGTKLPAKNFSFKLDIILNSLPPSIILSSF